MKIKKFLTMFFIIFILFLALLIINNKLFREKDNGIPILKITLKDTNLQTINDGTKNVKYANNIVELININNKDDNFIEENVELKGRGNFSWSLEKKSYQIKFETEKDLLGMGESKTWLLIANHADVSLMRNKLMYDIANRINMKYICDSKWIDLYINNEYIGNYLICEKIEVDKNRVNLKDDYGLVVELDNNYYYNEKNYFKTEITNSHFVLKDSVSDDIDNKYSKSLIAFEKFQAYINNFEELLYADVKDWEKISSQIDVESFIKFYFIQELSENPDGCKSSVFMYKDGEQDVLHMGPVWDFDLAVGNCNKIEWGSNTDVDYIINIQEYMHHSADWYTQLFTIPEFKELAIKIYNEEIKKVFMTATSEINEYESIITKSANMNFKKWKLFNKKSLFFGRGHDYKSSYSEEVELLRTWISSRVDYLNKRYSGNY